MMMGPNVFWNINDGTRTRLGTFVEWERRWNREWTTLVGLRNDMVWMNTGNVQAYNSSMMMFGMDAANFNARNHARTDANLDGSAILRFEPDQQRVFELGVSRKTRSPNLYERYAWSTNTMAMRMNGWFGDGNGYVGNLDVKPEKAHTVSFTAGWHDAARKDWELRITPYYTYVQDYIDVDKCVSPAMGGGMANCAATGTVTNNFVFLKFANHDAWLYGVNIAGKITLMDSVTSGRIVMRGTLGYVRGQRTDGVNLYHVMPINAKLALDHTLGGWTNGIELQMVGAKDQVSQVRNELTTPAYALVNLRAVDAHQCVQRFIQSSHVAPLVDVGSSPSFPCGRAHDPPSSARIAWPHSLLCHSTWPITLRWSQAAISSSGGARTGAGRSADRCGQRQHRAGHRCQAFTTPFGTGTDQGEAIDTGQHHRAYAFHPLPQVLQQRLQALTLAGIGQYRHLPVSHARPPVRALPSRPSIHPSAAIPVRGRGHPLPARAAVDHRGWRVQPSHPARRAAPGRDG